MINTLFSVVNLLKCVVHKSRFQLLLKDIDNSKGSVATHIKSNQINLFASTIQKNKT